MMNSGQITSQPDRFSLLYRLSQTFNASLNLDDVLNHVMDETIEATKAERGFVMLKQDSDELTFKTARGMDQTTVADPTFEVSRSIIKDVQENQEGVLTFDAQEDDRFSNHHSVLILGLRSIICVPIILREKFLGVIYIDNRLQAGRFTDDDLHLVGAIANSAAIAIENARLYEAAVEKGRMERELQMAYRVQSSLLPQETPDIPGWEFSAYWQPAREVAGDYYDFIQSGDDLTLVIADVTDKGMPAALFMAMTRSIIRTSMDQSGTISEGISLANRMICQDSTLAMPVTLFACQIHQNRRGLSYANAGHNPPLLYSSTDPQAVELMPTGIFIGYDCDADYATGEIEINPGDTLILYTDGIIDAMDENNTPFGEIRLKQILDIHKHKPVDQIIEAVQNAVQKHIGETDPFDDITLVIVRRTPEE